MNQKQIQLRALRSQGDTTFVQFLMCQLGEIWSSSAHTRVFGYRKAQFGHQIRRLCEQYVLDQTLDTFSIKFIADGPNRQAAEVHYSRLDGIKGFVRFWMVYGPATDR